MNSYLAVRVTGMEMRLCEPALWPLLTNLSQHNI